VQDNRRTFARPTSNSSISSRSSRMTSGEAEDTPALLSRKIWIVQQCDPVLVTIPKYAVQFLASEC